MKTGQIHLFDKDWDVKTIRHYKLGEGLEIDFTQMHNAPFELNFKNLMIISEHFGTQDIDWDNISEKGCETCDYRSRYGVELQIYNITKNYPADLIKE